MILENRHTLQKIEIIFGEAEDSLGHLVHFNFIFKLSYLNTAVLGTLIQKPCCSMSEINDFNKHPSMIIHLRGYRAHEAPQFIAGSMSQILFLIFFSNFSRFCKASSS